MNETVRIEGHVAHRNTGISAKVVFALMMREMATRYSRLTGGYVWAVIEPAAAISLLALVFSQVFRSPPVGTSFALFYATGYLPFMVFSDLSAKTAEALNFNRQLLNYPNVSVTDALVARFFLNLLTHLAVFALVSFGIVTVEDLSVHFDLALIGFGLALAAGLGFGLGCFNCLVNAVWPVWAQIWAVLMRPMFLISGIFFTFESVPRLYQDMLWFNPVVHAIGTVRAGVFPVYQASYAAPGYVILLSLGFGVTGLFFLTRYQSRILNN